MSMKAGNWIPVDRNVVYDLSPTAKEGQYSEQSAYLSLREDLEKGHPKKFRDYARMWKWSIGNTSRFFKKIGYKTGETLPEIAQKGLEQKRNKSGTKAEHVTMLIYNDLNTPVGTKAEQKRNKSGTHTINPNPNPNPKRKKPPENFDKFSDDFSFFFQSSKFTDTMIEFIQHRKNLKKPMTERAIKLLLSKLFGFAGQNTDKAVEILEQSILNGWQGVFELKSSNVKNGKTVVLEPERIVVSRGDVL